MKERDSGPLPPLLRVGIEAGVIDGDTARRIEALRRRRELGIEAGRHDESRQFRLGFVPAPDPDMTFEAMVPCAAHVLPLRLIEQLAQTGALPRSLVPLVLCGPAGTGKTHMLTAVKHRLGERALLLGILDLDADLDRAGRTGMRAELLSVLVGAEVLLLDDLQLVDGRPELQRALALVIDHRRAAGRTIVATASRPPEHLSGIDSHLRGRLLAGAYAAVAPPDATERRAILARAVAPDVLPADVLDHLTHNVTDDIRRLKAAAVQLLLMVSESDIPLSLEIARAVVPRPEDLEHREHVRTPGPATDPVLLAQRYRSMLEDAETEEEQALALQIALGDRLRQARVQGDEAMEERLVRALELIRTGRGTEALHLLASPGGGDAAEGVRAAHTTSTEKGTTP